jgi:hypothetical protein
MTVKPSSEAASPERFLAFILLVFLSTLNIRTVCMRGLNAAAGHMKKVLEQV